MLEEDRYFMQKALELAELAKGRTSPNPMVGAVVVREGEIVGTGYHARAGTPHAEVHALREAGDKARDATLYVTLEPCCHHGRTGPCTEVIIQAGIKRVVMAVTDPNPKVAGKGARRLREAGIEVDSGVLEKEALRLNESFIKYITTGLPFVTLKTAMSLDGKIATHTGESKWITGEQSRAQVHYLRHYHDAILVGVGTVLADNPSLTTRLPGGNGKDPVRVILDSRARTPLDAKVIVQKSGAPTIIAVSEEAPEQNIECLRDAGAQVVRLPSTRNGVSIPELLRELGRREITSVLVEGGAAVNGSFIAGKLVDKVYWFIAPVIIGGDSAPGPVGGRGFAGLNEVPAVKDIIVRHYGDDICIEGTVFYGVDENVHRVG